MKLPEWLELTLGMLGFFALISLGVIGALVVIAYQLRPGQHPEGLA